MTYCLRYSTFSFSQFFFQQISGFLQGFQILKGILRYQKEGPAIEIQVKEKG